MNGTIYIEYNKICHNLHTDNLYPNHYVMFGPGINSNTYKSRAFNKFFMNHLQTDNTLRNTKYEDISTVMKNHDISIFNNVNTCLDYELLSKGRVTLIIENPIHRIINIYIEYFITNGKLKHNENTISIEAKIILTKMNITYNEITFNKFLDHIETCLKNNDDLNDWMAFQVRKDSPHRENLHRKTKAGEKLPFEHWPNVLVLTFDELSLLYPKFEDVLKDEQHIYFQDTTNVINICNKIPENISRSMLNIKSFESSFQRIQNLYQHDWNVFQYYRNKFSPHQKQIFTIGCIRSGTTFACSLYKPFVDLELNETGYRDVHNRWGLRGTDFTFKYCEDYCHIDILSSWFPHCKIIQIVRDMRNAVYSVFSQSKKSYPYREFPQVIELMKQNNITKFQACIKWIEKYYTEIDITKKKCEI